MCVMGARDSIDATERLLGLPLRGEQEREVIRVIMECCFQEKTFNGYYPTLVARLAEVSRNHRMTLQYALWDQFRELQEQGAETGSARRLANLARFAASCVAKFALPLSVLRPFDLAEAVAAVEAGRGEGNNNSTKVSSFVRLTLYHVIRDSSGIDDLKIIFSRQGANPKDGVLNNSLKTFLQRVLGPWIAQKHAKAEEKGNEELEILGECLKRIRAAESALVKARPTAHRVESGLNDKSGRRATLAMGYGDEEDFDLLGAVEAEENRARKIASRVRRK